MALPSSRFIAFVAAAGTSVPFNLASRVLFSKFVPFEIALVLSHFVGMTIAFILTRRFVFERSGLPLRVEFVRFAIVNLLSLSITWEVGVSLARFALPAIDFRFQPEFVAHFIALAATAVVSYVGHSSFSFRRLQPGPAGDPHRPATLADPS